MNRRALLGVLATGLGSAAGCLALDRGVPGTTTDEDATTRSSTTTAPSTPDAVTTTGAERSTTDQPPDVTVRASAIEVVPQYVAMNTPDSVGVFGGRDEQFVLAGVAVTGSPAPPPDEFVLVAGDASYGVDTDAGRFGNRLWDRERPYGGDDRSHGLLVFPVPKPLPTGSAAITWPGGEHSLDGTAVAELARPPTDWEVREFAAPETVEPGEEATLSLTVANVGEADGTFVAALNRTGPAVASSPEAAVSLESPAGETASWEYGHAATGRVEGGDDVAMRFYLAWRDGRRTLEVAIESA